LPIDPRAAGWILPWLVGLGVISYLGQFPTSAPKSGWAFNLVLTAKQTIPFWWDLATVAVFSLVVYYSAVRFAQSRDRVAEAVAEVEDEMVMPEEPVTGGPAQTQAKPAPA
jgi:membrane protein implicated in regulation of membrane protease activity